jgi:hypothetical protein
MLTESHDSPVEILEEPVEILEEDDHATWPM